LRQQPVALAFVAGKPRDSPPAFQHPRDRGLHRSCDAGAGDDALTVGADIGAPITVLGGAGTNSLTVVGGPFDDTISVNPGAVFTNNETIGIAGGISFLTVDGGTGTDVINVPDNLFGTAFTTVVNSAGLDTVNVNDDDAGPASAIVQFNTSMQLGKLNIGSGGVVNMASNGDNLLQTADLLVRGTGLLDMFDNDLMQTPGSLAAIQDLINAARAGGAWTGPGITSTAARGNGSHNTTLGAMSGAEYASVHGGTFDSAVVAADAVVVKYTCYGDTDFNGTVNFDDYVRTDSGFSNHLTSWTNGDFNEDGTVNFDDYVLIDQAFTTQGATLRQ
jgi:hypothetical protein